MCIHTHAYIYTYTHIYMHIYIIKEGLLDWLYGKGRVVQQSFAGEAKSMVISQFIKLVASAVPICHWRPGRLLESCLSLVHVGRLKKQGCNIIKGWQNDWQPQGWYTHQQGWEGSRQTTLVYYLDLFLSGLPLKESTYSRGGSSPFR